MEKINVTIQKKLQNKNSYFIEVSVVKQGNTAKQTSNKNIWL